MFLEEICIKILAFFYKITGRIGENLRKLLIFSCVFSLSLMFSFSPQSVWDGRRMIYGTVILILLTLFSADREIIPVSWHKGELLLELFAIGIINIAFVHPVGYDILVFAADILLPFPALYIIWINRDDIETLYSIISAAILISGIGCFLYSIYLLLNGENLMVAGRFAGVTKNPNYYGMVGLSVILASEFMLINKKTSRTALAGLSVCAGIGTAMVIKSVSRTSILSAIISFTTFSIFFIKTIKINEHTIGGYIRRIIAAALIIVAASTAGVFLQNIDPSSTIDDDKVSRSIAAVNTDMALFVQNPNESEEQSYTIKERFGVDTDINSYSSGRIEIWNRYISYLNMIGNDYPEMYNKAHNNALDYAFRCGIPVGLMYVLFYCFIVTSALTRLFGRRYNRTAYFWASTITLIYAIYSVVEISTLPFTRYIPCLFFLSFSPLVIEKKGD